MLVDRVITRLDTQVDAFKKVEGAAAFAALIKSKKVPHQTPCAYVSPTGMRGGIPTTGAGSFVQGTTETISVTIMLRSNDRIGAKGVEPLDVLKRAAIDAICGWAPSDQTGVFALQSGRMISVLHGLITYSLEFSINDQVRILA